MLACGEFLLFFTLFVSFVTHSLMLFSAFIAFYFFEDVIGVDETEKIVKTRVIENYQSSPFKETMYQRRRLVF